MASFDRDKPYGEVYGEDRRRYYQNGCYYDVQGNLIEEPKEEKKPVEMPDDLDDMHWSSLAKLARKHGIGYTTREEVVKQLRSLHE